MEQRSNRRTSNLTGNQMEVQPNRSTSLWKSMGTVGEKLQESKVCSVGEQINHRGRSFNNDEYCRADIEPKRNVCLHTYHAHWNLLIIERSFDKLKPMQMSYGTDFVKNIFQL